MNRLTNLVGVFSLAVADRLAPDVPGRTLAGSSTAAALVTLLAHPSHGVGWLADVLGLTSSGATRLVERLLAEGLVHLGASADGRSRSLQLTEDGRLRAEEALVHRDAEIARSLACLSEAEQETLERLLATMVSALADDRPTALRVCRLCDRHACGERTAECPLEHTVPSGAY